ncbi:MAG: phosphoribosylanthranilate isomerase [Dehalococcoidia bacterium]
MSVAVKICGLRDELALETAIEAGADFVGFVFAPSKRRIAPEEAAMLVRRLGVAGPKAVGVFVDEDPAIVRVIADVAGLDLVQLCGSERPEEEWGRPVIRVIRPVRRAQWAAWAPWIARGARLHIDTPGSAGGTGVVGDWTVASRVARRVPILLAGGLNPENVARAIAAVQPWGVDVSGGVERDGQKDPAAIRSFIQAARAARRPEGHQR